jgi:hypothetical protein
MSEPLISKTKLEALIKRVNGLIPNSVNPATRISIHPCDWIALVNEVDNLQKRAAPETPAFTVEELMHEIHAAHAHTLWWNKPDHYSIPNRCECRFCKTMGPNAQKTSSP